MADSDNPTVTKSVRFPQQAQISSSMCISTPSGWLLGLRARDGGKLNGCRKVWCWCYSCCCGHLTSLSASGGNSSRHSTRVTRSAYTRPSYNPQQFTSRREYWIPFWIVDKRILKYSVIVGELKLPRGGLGIEAKVKRIPQLWVVARGVTWSIFITVLFRIPRILFGFPGIIVKTWQKRHNARLKPISTIHSTAAKHTLRLN